MRLYPRIGPSVIASRTPLVLSAPLYPPGIALTPSCPIFVASIIDGCRLPRGDSTLPTTSLGLTLKRPPPGIASSLPVVFNPYGFSSITREFRFKLAEASPRSQKLEILKILLQRLLVEFEVAEQCVSGAVVLPTLSEKLDFLLDSLNQVFFDFLQQLAV